MTANTKPDDAALVADLAPGSGPISYCPCVDCTVRRRAAARIEQLVSERDTAVRDAERYRFLRHATTTHAPGWEVVWWSGTQRLWCVGKVMDERIDRELHNERGPQQTQPGSNEKESAETVGGTQGKSQATIEEDAAIAALVQRKLTSGNAIPVERCTVLATEIAAIRALASGSGHGDPSA